MQGTSRTALSMGLEVGATFPQTAVSDAHTEKTRQESPQAGNVGLIVFFYLLCPSTTTCFLLFSVS